MTAVIKSSRIQSIDILRGLVMVIMALDHTRGYFHLGAWLYDATDLETTTPVLFFTRFVTHFCAPVFVFLTGTSASLFGQNKSKKSLSIFLFTRGLWLIFVEIVIMNFLWWFDISYGFKPSGDLGYWHLYDSTRFDHLSPKKMDSDHWFFNGFRS